MQTTQTTSQNSTLQKSIFIPLPTLQQIRGRLPTTGISARNITVETRRVVWCLSCMLYVGRGMYVRHRCYFGIVNFIWKQSCGMRGFDRSLQWKTQVEVWFCLVGSLPMFPKSETLYGPAVGFRNSGVTFVFPERTPVTHSCYTISNSSVGGKQCPCAA